MENRKLIKTRISCNEVGLLVNIIQQNAHNRFFNPDNINKHLKGKLMSDEVTDDFKQDHRIIKRKNILKHHFKDVRSVANYKLQQKDGANMNVELFPAHHFGKEEMESYEDNDVLNNTMEREKRANLKKEVQVENHRLKAEFESNPEETIIQIDDINYHN